jgi:hypothetical protein
MTHDVASTRTAPHDRARRRLFAPRVFNSRTRQRFLLDRTTELIRHLGRDPSYAARVLIARAAANEWDLRKLDARLDSGGELSGHAARLRLALENRLRLDLRDLGVKPAAPPAPILADLFPGQVA